MDLKKTFFFVLNVIEVSGKGRGKSIFKNY